MHAKNACFTVYFLSIDGLTCEQDAMTDLGRPMEGAQATSLTQSL